MAAVIFSTIFFLATVPMPGGASIWQTGTTPSFHVRALPLSPIAAQRVGAVRCAIWTARPGVHSWSRGADPSGRCLIVHFCRPDGSRTTAFLTTTACCDHFTPHVEGELCLLKQDRRQLGRSLLFGLPEGDWITAQR